VRAQAKTSSAANRDGSGFLAAVRSRMSFAGRGVSVGTAGSGAPSAAGAARTGTGSVPASAVLALAILALIAGLAVSIASASKQRELAIGTGTPDSAATGSFDDQNGVAANHSSIADGSTDPLGNSTDGYVYVADEDNHRVQVFDSSGEFQFMFGGSVNAGTGDPNVCTNAGPPSDDCQAGDDASTAGGFLDDPQSIAIDQSDGSVYVGDEDNARIQKFDAAGNFLLAIGEGVNADTAADVCTAASGNTCQVGGTSGAESSLSANFVGSMTVDPNGTDLYVADEDNSRIQVFDSAGNFQRTYGYGVDDGTGAPQVCTSGCQSGMAGSAPGQLDEPTDVAIDDDGHLFVSDDDTDRVLRFDDGVAFASPLEFAPAQLTDQAPGWIEIDTGTAPGIADDRVYVVQGGSTNSGVVNEFGPGGALLDTHGAGAGFGNRGTAGGLGIDPGLERIYASDDSDAFVYALSELADPVATLTLVDGVDATSATLHGEVNPTGSQTNYRFEHKPSSAPDEPVSWTSVPVPDGDAGSGSGAAPVPDETITGLEPNTSYDARLVASKPFGGPSHLSGVESFNTDPAPPIVTSTSVDSIQDTSARLVARIDPQSQPTVYQFQYGTDTGYGDLAPISLAPVGAGASDVFVSAEISGLDPATEYHFRVLADNPTDTAFGPDRSFTTRAAPLDATNRAYELVSPADKIAGGVGGSGSPVSLDGSRVISASSAGDVLIDGGFGFGNDFALSERLSDSEGWVSKPVITRPNFTPFTLAVRIGLYDWSDDLSLLNWGPSGGELKLFPELAGLAMFERQPGYVSDSASGKWEVLAPLDLINGELEPGLFGDVQHTSGDHVLVSARIRDLLDEPGEDGIYGTGDDVELDPAHAQLAGGAGGDTLYAVDTSGGLSDSFPGEAERSLVGLCTDPAGRTEIPLREAGGELGAQACPDGADELISERGAAIGRAAETSHPASTKNTISDDGSRIFFMSPDPRASGSPAACSGTDDSTSCPAQLYVRQENAPGEFVTRWLSRPEVEDQEASLLGRAYYEGASKDGSRVFFRTATPLTDDDPNGGCGTPCTTGSPSDESWDLYMYELADGPDPSGPGAALTRISAGPTDGADANVSAPGGSKPDGTAAALRFASDDGSRVYFATAAEIPVPGAPAPHDEEITAPGGTPLTEDMANLYLYDHQSAAERWRFVARIPRFLGSGATTASCASVGAVERPVMSLGGNFAVLPLSSGDTVANCVRGNADGTFVTFWTPGRLLAGDLEADSADIYAYDAAADRLARVSAPQGGEGEPYLCDEAPCYGDMGLIGFTGTSPSHLGVATHPTNPGDRIAFFHSRSRLVPEDVNDAYDVYEWRNGRLSLITPGTGDEDVLYMGNGASGRDVFFKTSEALTWQDTDAVADIYDARIGGGIEPPASGTPACDVLAGSCEGASPPERGEGSGAGSAAFSGPGNVAAPVRRPSRCAKHARNAQRASRNARRLRRGARQASGRRAGVLHRRASRAANTARRTSRGAKRCRARARAAGAGRRASR